MLNLQIIFTLTFAVLLNSVCAVMRPTEKLYLIDDEGFIVFLEVPKSFGAIQNCWFKFRDTTKVKLELNATDPITTDRGELILPFSRTICGIRVKQLSSASAAVWSLEAESTFGDFEEGKVTIQILPHQKKRFETHLLREIGQGTIACSKHEYYTKHCKIIDDSGEIWSKCEISATIRPNKTFECLTYNWGRMSESQEHIIIDIKNSTVYTTASVTDTETNVVLRCQFDESVFSCQAEMPDHKSEIYIMDGLYNGRYSSYDTVVSKSKCALEIPKPFESSELGLWRIINYESSIPSGCLFYIGVDKKKVIEREVSALDKVKVMKLYKPESDLDNKIAEISCTVPFVIDDCFLRDPNNTVYFPENLKFQRYRLYGKCAFTNMPIIEGIWTCGARGHDYEKEILQDIEVIVKSKRGEVLTQTTKVKRGKTVELMCKSAYEQPISHCAFIDPAGYVYLVGTAKSIKTKGHVQYFGHGLQWGECGIKISDLNANDFGTWKCQFITYAGRLESTFVMQLTESAIGHATSVGLGVGLTVIILLIMGVVIGTIFYRKRNLSAQHTFSSVDPVAIDVSQSATIATSQL